MNKEIKSRVWDEIDKKMYYAGECKLSIDLFGHIFDDESDEPTRSMNHRMKLLQGTGHKDKNGVEIYDGDIVKAIAEEEYFECSKISQIARSSTNTSWCVLKTGYTLGMHLLWGGWKSLEIIGNIYQNPKLLS